MKPFSSYQYLMGEEMTDRDKREIGSKFWNAGKWENFVLPFLPKEASGMKFVDVGCNAGLFLALASDYGFDRIVGIDSDRTAIDRGMAWRDKNGYSYTMLYTRMEECIDKLPLADYTVLANTHYYFTINDWLDYLDKLQYKTRYCVIVTAESSPKQLCWASANPEDILSYFYRWKTIGTIGSIDPTGDPMPRKLWGYCFESPYIERVPIDSIHSRNTMIVGFYQELDRGTPYKETRFYKDIVEYRKKWRLEKVNGWVEERIRIYEDVKKNGLKRPIYVNGDDMILDGNHRYYAMKHLGNTSIIIRRT